MLRIAREDFAGATTVRSPGWLHRAEIEAAGGWVATEQVRTLSADRFRRPAPEVAPTAVDENKAAADDQG